MPTQILSPRELACLWKGAGLGHSRACLKEPASQGSRLSRSSSSVGVSGSSSEWPGSSSSSRKGESGGPQGRLTHTQGQEGVPCQGVARSEGSSSTNPHLQPSLTGAGARLARYCLARTRSIFMLLQQLATVPECFEMARATGLTLNQVRPWAASLEVLFQLFQSLLLGFSVMCNSRC